MRHPFPLRYSIPASLAALALVLTAIASALDWTHTNRAVTDLTLRRAAGLGTVLSRNMIGILARGEQVEAAAEMATLASVPNLSLALVLDDSNRVLYATDSSHAQRPLADTPSASVDTILRKARLSLRPTLEVAGSGTLVRAAFPFALTERIGEAGPPRTAVLYTETDLLALKRAERAALRFRSTVMLAAAVLLCLGMWFYLRAVLALRVASLVHSAGQFAVGEESRQPELRGSDELAQVGAALKRMYGALTERTVALRRNEEQLTFALQTSRVGAWQLNLGDHSAERTLRHDQIFGYQELLPSWTYELFLEHVVPDDRAEVDRSFREATANGSDWSFECRIRCADGAERWIWAAGGHQFSPDGKPTLLSGIVQDVTAHKQEQAAHLRRELQLRQAQKMESLGTLAGGIAHDFNNMLAAILGYADLARQSVDAQHPARAYVDEIAAASGRARDLVRRILAFSRQDIPQRVPLNLPNAVDEAIRLLRSVVPSGIAMHVAHAPAVSLVMADTVQVHQVVMNLVTNAWHAMEHDVGRIDIEIDQRQVELSVDAATGELPRGLYVCLSVRDNGRGMDQATQERMFDPFFTTEAPGHGTGLGMSVVHGIMRGHEGSTVVESHVGRGTTVTVCFPALHEGARVEAPPHHAAPDVRPVGATGKHILYLDDEPALVALARRLLELRGYRVTGCTTPADAIAAFQSDPLRYDLVVTDFSMPGMSGLEVTRELQMYRPDLPIVLVSGNLSPQRLEEARLCGVREVLFKPFSAVDLAAAIERVLAISANPP